MTVIPEVIKGPDIGLLEFDKNTGKAIVPDCLVIQIIKLGSKYYQNIDSPFLRTNSLCMNKAWFKKKLGNRGEEVNRS